MIVDCSEVKSFKECRRSWYFQSRNGLHLTNRAPQDNLIFGTIFHEALAKMYMGVSIDKVIKYAVEAAINPVHVKVFEATLSGYYSGPYQTDVQLYDVLDIEHSFVLKLPGLYQSVIDYETGEVIETPESITVRGSIDMICKRKVDGAVFGFEHKTAGKFRPPIYTFLDEQPRLYTLALQQYCKDKGLTYGGIFLNQVRKLQRFFEYQRDLCVYTPKELERFTDRFIRDAKRIQQQVNGSTIPLPEPGYMKCTMCRFADICQHYGYDDSQMTLDNILEEFSEEFAVRECDHLEEKVSRSVDDD